MKKTNTINTDKISALIMLVLSGVFWSQLIGQTFTQYGILYPKVILVILIVLSVALLVKSWFTPDLKKISREEDKKMIIFSIIGIIVWIWIIPILGFVVGSAICFSILSSFISERKNLTSILSIILIVFGITVLFWFVLHQFFLVPFPTGLFI